MQQVLEHSLRRSLPVSRTTGSPVSYEAATMLEGPKLIDDILLLPIRAMSTCRNLRIP